MCCISFDDRLFAKAEAVHLRGIASKGGALRDQICVVNGISRALIKQQSLGQIDLPVDQLVVRNAAI